MPGLSLCLLTRLDKRAIICGMGKAWTSQEDKELLRLAAGRKTPAEIAVLLGKTKRGVQRRLQGHAKAGKWVRVDLVWPPEDVKVLEASLGSKSLSVIADRLGRTVSAVWKKAKRMGLIDGKHTKPDAPRIVKNVRRPRVEGKVEWCEVCRSPVVNWGQHFARMPGCRSGRLKSNHRPRA